MIIIVFFAVLALLILSHEFGHFLFAKLNKVKVEEFGFGLPPKILWFKKGETVYSFNLFPIGGFVRIFGEDGAANGANKEENNRNFNFKPVYAKASIVVAGVLFNLILAWILFSSGYFIGMPSQIGDDDADPEAKVFVTYVSKNSVAEKAGLAAGDAIIGFKEADPKKNRIEIFRISEVQEFIINNKGKEIEIFYEREGKNFSVKTVPRIDASENEGSLGVAMARVGIVKKSLSLSLWSGLRQTVSMTILVGESIFYFIAGLFKGVGIEQVAGPIGIFNLVGDVSKMGFIYVLNLTAILSVNLAVINLIPFPGLDGSRLVFLLIEKIKGSPISYKITNIVHSLGLALLILLMILISYNDLLKF